MKRIVVIVLSLLLLFLIVNYFLNNDSNLQKVKIVNGYTLPPEPDEELNNATLLGIDSNMV